MCSDHTVIELESTPSEVNKDSRVWVHSQDRHCRATYIHQVTGKARLAECRPAPHRL